MLDRNNATDGDLLIAWGLAEAGRRWSAAAYTAEARKIALSLASKAVFATAFGPALRRASPASAPTTRHDGPLVNLSYWVFPGPRRARRRRARRSTGRGSRRSGLALFDAAQFGPLGAAHGLDFAARRASRRRRSGRRCSAMNWSARRSIWRGGRRRPSRGSPR